MRFKQNVWVAGLAMVLLALIWVGESGAQDEPAHSSEAKWVSRVTMGDQVLTASTGFFQLTE